MTQTPQATCDGLRHIRAGSRLLLPLLLLVWSGCATASQIAERGDLDVAVARHHTDLRWGRVPNAARFVHKDLQTTFIEDWERRLKQVDLTDVEVMQVFETGEGIAEVTVRFVYVDKNTQQLREHTSSERWELTDGNWIATRVAELDDGA